jgi:thymidylate synthase (FAD)
MKQYLKAEHIGHYGDDLLVVNVARCSNDKWHDRFDAKADSGLIDYLARKKHKSPFMHPKVSFRLTLPIFVARQWERHRISAVRQYDIFDMNEVSRRYVTTTPEFFIPDQWRAIPEGSIKQGSGGALPVNIQPDLMARYLRVVQDARAFYDYALSKGCAPEQARSALPQSMLTKWIETGSLYYWFNLCSLRLPSDAQTEIQFLAAQVYEVCNTLFPISWAALVKNCPEALCDG